MCYTVSVFRSVVLGLTFLESKTLRQRKNLIPKLNKKLKLKEINIIV